jgi:hypothetical protein
MKEELEVWKDIPGYEGLYQVSNLGRVKSLPKEQITANGVVKKYDGKILKGSTTTSGYRLIVLCVNRNVKAYTIHQLVAMSFLNHKPDGHKLVIDHINDNKSDNRVENLQIVTQRVNTCKTQGKYSSKYKGVCYNKKANKWQSNIRINGKLKHLGLFKCELAASYAYQKALKELL